MLKILRNILKPFRRMKRRYYKLRVKKTVKSYGTNLQINGKVNLTKRTTLGNNVRFNGCTIGGGGML